MVLSVLERQNNEQNVRYENVKIPIPRVVTTNYSSAPFTKISAEYSKLFDELEQQSPGNPEGINYHEPTIELELFGRGEYKPSGSIKKPTNNQTLYSTAATDSSIEFRPEDYPAKNWGSDSNYIKYPQPVTTIESIISSTDTPGFTSQFKTGPEYLFKMERTSSLQPKLQNIAQSTLTIPDNNPYSPPSQGLFTRIFHSLANPPQRPISQIQNVHPHPSQWLLQTNSPQPAAMQQSHPNIHHHILQKVQPQFFRSEPPPIQQPVYFVQQFQDMFRTPPPVQPTQPPIYYPPPPNIQSYHATVPPQPSPTTYPIFHSLNMTPIQTTTFAAPRIQYPFYTKSTPQFYHSFPIERKQQQQIFAD